MSTDKAMHLQQFPQPILDGCRAIAAAPNQLELRKRLADLYDQFPVTQEDARDRARLMREQLQFRLADPLELDAMGDRRHWAEMIAKYADSPYWIPLGDERPLKWDFRRGMVEWVQVRTVEGLASVAEWNPIRCAYFDGLPEEAVKLLAASKPAAPYLMGLDLRNCAIDDAWLSEFAGLGWACEQMQWLALNRNPGITPEGFFTLAGHFPNLHYVELNGLAASPLADDDGYLPPSGRDLEQRCGETIPWLHRDYWIDHALPPTALQLLDLCEVRSMRTMGAGATD